MTRRRSTEFAAELVDWYGVAGVDELAVLAKQSGVRIQRGELTHLCDVRPDLIRFEDLYFSLSSESRIAKCLRVLRSVGVVSADDMCGGIRRSMGSGESINPATRRTAANKAYELLEPLLDSWPGPSVQDLQGDRRLVELMRRSAGGILLRHDLDELIRSDPKIDATLVSSSYSPVLEMVAGGTFGVRGAPIDLAAVEALRPRRKGPWSRWGRLDRSRLWVEVKTSGEAIRVRIPADCRELLEHRQWTLSSPAGGVLGLLTVESESAIHIDWRFGAPADWIAEEHAAVLEFDVPQSRVRLFGGTSVEEGVDPRNVDGCVLIGGYWHFNFEVDNSRVGSDPVSIPLGVSGLEGIEVGSCQIFRCGHLDLEVRREPHSLRVLNAEAVLEGSAIGSFVRLGFRAGRCDVAISDPPTSDNDRLLKYAGVFDTPAQRWSAIGTSLGIGGVCDKRRVRQALADRERFDLISIMNSSGGAKEQSSRPLLSTEQFSVQEGRLRFWTADGAVCAEQLSGTGLLGLRWTHEDLSTISDQTWSTYCLLIIRVWGRAASGSPVTISRSSEGWNSPLLPAAVPKLLDALEQLAATSGLLDESIISADVPLVPLRALGFLRAFAAADGYLDQLEISTVGWTGIDRDGQRFGPSPVDALSLRPDANE